MPRQLFSLSLFVLFAIALLLLSCQPIQPQLAMAGPAEVSAGLAVTDTVSISATTPTAAPTTITSQRLITAAEISPELITAGKDLYLDYYCGICHELDALETRGTFGPSHNGIGQRAAQRIQDPNYHGHALTAAEYLWESLTEPTIYIVPEYGLTSHPMPNYGYLSEADLEALVALLLQQ